MAHVGPDLAQKSLQKSRQILLRFLMRTLIDLGRLLGRFGDPCGRPWGVQGASWRGLLTGFLARCSPGGLNRRSLRILAPFLEDLGSIFKEFWRFG